MLPPSDLEFLVVLSLTILLLILKHFVTLSKTVILFELSLVRTYMYVWGLLVQLYTSRPQTDFKIFIARGIGGAVSLKHSGFSFFTIVPHNFSQLDFNPRFPLLERCAGCL